MLHRLYSWYSQPNCLVFHIYTDGSFKCHSDPQQTSRCASVSANKFRSYDLYLGGCIQKFPDWVDNEYTLTFVITRWEATQRVMAAKLTRLTHKIAIQLHLVAESFTICSSRSRRPVRILLDTPSYITPGSLVMHERCMPPVVIRNLTKPID
jgi:hypothetical protein